MPTTFRAPAFRPIDVADPARALDALAGLPYPFLLHSSLRERRGRWSFFGADPFEVHRGGEWDVAHDSFRAAARRARGARAGTGEPVHVPFTGGAVGYWSYDFGRRFERLPAIAADDTGLPDFVMGFYDVVGAIDHTSGEAWLFSSGLPLEDADAERRALERLDAFARRLEVADDPALDPGAVTRGAPRPARSTFTTDGYRTAVEAVREHIRRGDLFQANLSQRWTLALDETPRAETLARRLALGLAAVSPAPFAAFFGTPDHTIVSASPERFLEVRGREVEARPIKGTRPRGICPAEDRALAAELEASAKDRAENVMIVDVLRNDLGRVCEAGSVMVPELCALETFPQVFHLTSSVTGTLSAGVDALDLLVSAFPGGSITGAPKIRAMEILEGLEPVRRHIYTGSIGYVDWGGDADWNIAIRTALVTPGKLHFAAGGGITAESDADAEYLETLHKAEGMRLGLALALGPVELVPRAAGA
jgi:para-aminobenzoate synthetase component 1